MTKNPVFIITGKQGEGKTTLLTKVVSLLKNNKIPMSGFVAKGYWKNNKRWTFDLIEVGTGKTIPLCYRNRKTGIGFVFNTAALRYGNSLLQPVASAKKTIYIIDEIGKMEIKEKIWYNALSNLLSAENSLLLITVREAFTDEIIKKFKLTDVHVYHTLTPPEIILNEIITAV